MKKVIPFLLVVSLTAICFAQNNQTESITISTYYPSPSGIYRNLKFTPTDIVPQGSALSPGVIYYNNTDDKLRYYNLSGSWVNLTGGGSGGYWALDSTGKILTNTNPGKISIEGVEANDEIFQARGNASIKNAVGNTMVYLDRAGGASNSGSENLLFGTWLVKDSWDFGSGMSNPAYLIIGNLTPANVPTYQVTVLPSGNVGIRTHPTQPFWGATAKLHITGEEAGGSPDQPLLYLQGDGTIALEMESASDNGSQGPEICSERANGSLAGPSAVPPGYTLLEVQPNGYVLPSVSDQRRGAEFGFFSGGNSAMSSASSPGAVFFGNTRSGVFDITNLTMMITDSGNVGVGYDPWTVNNKFLVIVDSAIRGFVDSATGAWQPPSDKRLKKNISGIENALAKVVRVQGVRYDPVTETSSMPQKGRLIGFIGQDLENEFPELVSTDSKGYKSVSYEIMTPVLVEAIKGQQKEIESLRKEIEVLKSRKKQSKKQGVI